MKTVLLAAFLAAIFPACKSPGATCDECSQAESAPPPSGVAAFNRGGQSADSQPRLEDIGAQNPVTPISRGSGNQDVKTDYSADKTQAGSIAVT